MVRHLCEDLPRDCERQGLQKGEVEGFVHQQIAKGRQYGIESGLDLKTYIECAAAYGREFDRDPGLPWAAAALERSDFTPREKTNLLHDRLIFRP
jgi:hypothetical protein